MAKGKFSVVHKTSGGEEVDSLTNVTEDEVINFTEDNASELEGDSGASITVTWED